MKKDHMNRQARRRFRAAKAKNPTLTRKQYLAQRPPPPQLEMSEEDNDAYEARIQPYPI